MLFVFFANAILFVQITGHHWSVIVLSDLAIILYTNLNRLQRMHSFFAWLSSLHTAQQTILVLMVLLVLVGIPYVGLLSRVLSLLLHRQFHPQILFFGLNYAISEEPAPPLPTFRQKIAALWQRIRKYIHTPLGKPISAELPPPPSRSTVYYTENVPEFYVEGSVAELAWEVTGAYRIDVLPIRTRVKGNGLRFLFDSRQQHFVLRAYGLYGQTEATFSLPQEKFQHLHQEPLSRNTDLVSKYRTPRIHPPAWKEHPMRQPRVAGFVRTMPTQRKTPLPSGLQRLVLDHTLSSHYTFSTHKYPSFYPSKKSKS